MATDKLRLDELYISRFQREDAVALQQERRVRPSSLVDWLHEPGFFPRSFGRERVEVLPEGVFVIGREEVYRFPRSEIRHGSVESFRSRWARALEELEYYETFAPGLYLGLRTFQWEQGVPLWLQDEPLHFSEAKHSPHHSTGFAFVLRRVFSARTWKEVIEQNDGRGIKFGISLAKRLRRHHDAKIQRVPLSAKGDTFTADFFRRRYLQLDGHEEAIGVLGRSDPLASLALAEGVKYLVRSFDKVQHLLRERQLQLRFVPRFSLLDPERVIAGEFRRSGLRLFALGSRNSRSHSFPSNAPAVDPLAEVARTAVFLEAHGSDASAKDFERSYGVEAAPWFDPHIFRFFKISYAVSRAVEVLSGDASSHSALQDAADFSRVGLRYAFGLDRCFALALECDSTVRSLELGALLAGYLTIPSVPGRKELSAIMRELKHFHPALHEDFMAQRMEVLGDRELGADRSVIFEDSAVCFRPLLRRIACRYQIPYLIVPLAVSGGALRPDAAQNASLSSGSNDLYFYDPILSPAENALWILRELSVAISSHATPV